ncbi:MAG: hypothetical protein IJR82_00865 [Bacilli bacterium]|nr:hypothetical protein [Bacilli bacterium]
MTTEEKNNKMLIIYLIMLLTILLLGSFVVSLKIENIIYLVFMYVIVMLYNILNND